MTNGGSSLPEVQKLLAVLAAGRTAAEAGTAFGEGTRALASSARKVVSVEIDDERADIARSNLADLSNVELLRGDWRTQLCARAPFGFFFLDSGGFKEAPEEVGALALDLLEPGGILLVDDMTPGLEEHDPARRSLFDHTELVATEVLTTRETSVIIASRL